MFNNRRKIEKWSKGPGGFAGKANRQIDAIEQRLPGVAVGRGLLGERAIVLPGPWFYAKVTASSSLSEDHTLVELDANGDVLVDGREPTDAKALNGRMGVPVDTIVIAFERGIAATGDAPVYSFVLGEGQTGTPEDLTSALATARTSEWDVESQGSSKGVLYQPARTYVANNDFSVFYNEVTTDASGDTIYVGPEVQGQLVGDTVLATIEGHIQIGGYSGAPAGSKKILLGPPLADHRTLVFVPGTGIDLNGGSANVEVEFDNSGRALIANAGADQSITINATGGGSADGQGYEDVHYNGASVEAITDAGIINFADSAASAAAGSQEVNWTITNPVAGTAKVEGVVDIDAYLKSLSGYDAAKTQVLTNTSGTIGWTDTAECP